MKDPIAPEQCPKCGNAIPAEAEQGLCPRCALAAVATSTEAGQPVGESLPPPSLESVATAFPQLEILELIGTGGMGAVYKARQPRLDRLVALKLLSPALAGTAAFAERFNREARMLARLNHPGIVSVYDYGEAGGFFYLLMEFVDGVNLRQAMHAGRFTPAQALGLVPAICEALQFAHDEGILHRDIKPANILLDTRGRVKIADFGIAKLLGDRVKGEVLTASGLTIGTPHYMAPEQLEHPQDVDQRADIYSLGVVFYEMLTGELPLGRFAPPSKKTPMDPRVDEVVLRALEKERDRRQRNVTEVKLGVEQITGTPASSPAAPAPKTSLCYVSTPEYLRTLRGRFLYIYQGNGQLRLDDRTLSFSSGWHSVTIPLTSIRSLARGEYSLAAKPIPLHYLEVAFEDHGTPRTLLFTPTRSGLLPAWETNKDVAEWLNAIQVAAEKASGRPLPLSQSSGTSRGWGALSRSLGLTALICSLVFLAIPLVVEHRLPNRWTDYLPGPLLAVISLGLGLSLRAWMERRASTRGNLDELTHLPGSSPPRVGGTTGIAEPQAPSVVRTNPARADSLGWNLLYLLTFLALCFLIIGPWIGDFTGRPFPYPMPESVGKPVALLTLLLVVYGAVHKSWRLTRRPAGSPAPGTDRNGAMPVPVAPVHAGDTPNTTGKRQTRCHFSNPERLRRCFPSATAPLFHCDGELQLATDHLRFTSSMRATLAIPLHQIRELGVGMFRMWNTPWLGTRYERLHYLVITYQQDGIPHAVALTPVPVGATSAAIINHLTGKWHDDVLDAIRSLGLPAPSTPPTDCLLTGVQQHWWRAILPLLAVSIVATLATVLFPERPNPWLLLGSFIPAIIVCLLGVGFFKMNTAIRLGRLDSFTGEEPPESYCGSAAARHSPSSGTSWKAVASAVCALPSWLIVVGLLTGLHDSLGPDGLPPTGFHIATFELLTLATGGFVGLAALFLGADALREIRKSRGAIRGARLAAAGLLGIPTAMMIKVIPALAASLARSFGWNPSEMTGQVFVGSLLIVILLLTAFAAWRLRRWARFGEGSPTVMESEGGTAS